MDGRDDTARNHHIAHLVVHPEVRDALAEGRPVVALESTIISHGMPYPQNVETAREVEGIVRDGGAVPATIAVLAGRVTVGLEGDALERLGRGEGVEKLSRRDLPIAVARGADGATTVAATMAVAALAGIEVFVTGGIGGVHRGAAQSFDVSADLQELARTGVAVVCAGAKAVLDLGLTLEYLETHGVPVIGYRTDRLPAFYTRDSGFGVDHRAESAEAVAEIFRIKQALGLAGGLVVANPIPRRHEMDPGLAARAIRKALEEAEERRISGKDVTPFLLSRVEELTGGESLRANRELIFSNAGLGSRIATALARRRG